MAKHHSQPGKVDSRTLDRKDTYIGVGIIAALFFIFGFTSWINAILIPYFKITCELNNFQSYLVTLAFYIAYFIMSVPSSFLLRTTGFKKGMMIGLFSMSAGALLFVPAAMERAYGIFLAGLFFIGTGLAILQTAANPYITIIGPRESAARRISIMGVCNKGAGIIAPLIFAALVLKSTDQDVFKLIESGTLALAEKNAILDELVLRVITPYACLSALLFAFGLFIRFSPLPEIDTNTNADPADAAGDVAGKTSIFRFPHLVLGVLAMFFHVGTQILAIDTVIGYAQSMGIGLLEAKVFPSYILGATMMGYLIGIVCIPRIFSQRKALIACTVLGLLLSAGVLLSHGSIAFLGHRADISIWFLVMLGLPNSLVYAGIWPLAIKGLGRFTELGSSMLVMALCGNAVNPLIYGALADACNHRIAYIILIPFYMYLIFYATCGYKIKHWRKNN
ncbi:MAG: sugar MFS transporter [Dysgonamonadaceae bacterium]|jgi:glucose/galactose transporter|nr:sugar MFS transporter [Dysgonamonadaceae bacterium]